MERHKAKFGEAPVSLHIQVLREAGEAKSGGNALLFKASVFKRSIMCLTIHVHLLVISPPIIFSSLSPSLPNPLLSGKSPFYFHVFCFVNHRVSLQLLARALFSGV